MTATERPRELLDEHNAEYAWEQVTEGTLFHVSVDGKTVFILMRGGSGLEMWSQYLTPEQAVAATLGDGRTADLETELRDMFAALCSYAPPEECQRWADRMENVGVYADWGWSQ